MVTVSSTFLTAVIEGKQGSKGLPRLPVLEDRVHDGREGVAAAEVWTVMVGTCDWSQHGADRKRRQTGGRARLYPRPIPCAPCLLARLSSQRLYKFPEGSSVETEPFQLGTKC